MIRSTVRLLVLFSGALLAARSPRPAGPWGPPAGAAAGWNATSPASMAGATLADALPYASGFVVVGAGPDVTSGQAGGMWLSTDGSTWNAGDVDLRSAHVKAVTAAGDG